MSAFIDTNIPMYAGGAPHPLRVPCQRVIKAIVAGEIEAVTDSEVLQEILYRYLKLGEREKGFKVFDSFQRIMSGVVLPVEEQDILKARELVEQYSHLSPRDSVHLAVMLNNGISEIISTDRDFDRLEGIRRLDPMAVQWREDI